MTTACTPASPCTPRSRCGACAADLARLSGPIFKPCSYCRGTGEVLISQPVSASAPDDWGTCPVCHGDGTRR